MSASRRKHEPAFKARSHSRHCARSQRCPNSPFASGSIHIRSTLGRRRWCRRRLRVFADRLGPSDQLSERKLAEIYEQLGRVTMERDFLLRRSGL